MPEVDNEAKTRLEEMFWAHLEARYPLTHWWWTEDRPRSVGLFPEWSAAAFDRERTEWRRLSQESVRMVDEETRHWGRFARWVATRLGAGSFRDGAEPLRHANLVLTMAAILDPAGTIYPRMSLVDALGEWLARVQDVTTAGFWRKTRAGAEGARLIQQLRQLMPPADVAPDQFRTHTAAAGAQVSEYLERTAVPLEEWPGESAPWAFSAHVSVEEWRLYRQAMTGEVPVATHKPREDSVVLMPKMPHTPAIQEVIIPGLKQWWVKPSGDHDVLFHGDVRDPSLGLGVALSVWRQEAASHNLTWALTHPPYADGGLMTAVEVLQDLWPTWEPVRSRFFQQWLQKRRVLAAADAWLWLEGADGVEVLAWMSRFIPKQEALSVIPWMKSHPGYYVMGHRVYTQLVSDHYPRTWDHWIWHHGPIMPDAVFLSPEQIGSEPTGPHDPK